MFTNFMLSLSAVVYDMFTSTNREDRLHVNVTKTSKYDQAICLPVKIRICFVIRLAHELQL